MSWIYNGKIRRKAANAFVDDTEDTKKPICPKCYDKGINTDLVPYLNDQGVREDNFRRCPMCGAGIPVKELKFETKLEDFVDVESANKPSEFVVVEERRRISKSQTRQNNTPEVYEVPKFSNGERDTELENLLHDRPGIVTALADSDIGEEQEEDY